MSIHPHFWLGLALGFLISVGLLLAAMMGWLGRGI